ncbi:MAG: YqaA family protein [Bacteroidia bacterium]|nr:YqaA family protein [Bacteroidia bacterium]
MGELGYFALFISSFLAATVLPFSSEAIVAAMIIGPFNPYMVFIIATMGNWLGSVVTYYMGYAGNWDRIEKWLKIERSKTERYILFARKYGAWMGFLVWVPLIGDILALCLGLIRCNPIISNVTILIGKCVRYAVVIYLTTMVK